MRGTKNLKNSVSQLCNKRAKERQNRLCCFLFIFYSFALTFSRCFFKNYREAHKKCIFFGGNFTNFSTAGCFFAGGGGIYEGAGRKILDRVGNSGTFHILMLPASRITER
jgi:hypothetical protein